MGNCTFTQPAGNLVNSYIPDSSDTSAGSVVLILTSTNNQTCNAVNDTLNVIITPAPKVFAGNDIALCLGNPVAQLSGNITGGFGTGVWQTLGSGTFSPNDSTLSAQYFPGQSDTAAGSVLLLLSSSNNGNCLTETDTVMISWSEKPTVFAGTDTTYCVASGGLSLSGIISGGTSSGVWTTNGSGTFTPSADSMNVTYMPGASDISGGGISIILTSTGGCVSNSDTIDVTISPSPSANFNIVANCDNFVVSFSDQSTSSSGSIGGWQWDFGDSNISTSQNPQHTFASAGQYNIQLVVTADGTCTDTLSQSLDLNVTQAGFISVGGCIADGSSFTDTSKAFNDSIASWNWQFGDGFSSSSQSPQHQYSSPGNYTVSLIIQTQKGCADTVNMSHIVNPNPVAAFEASVEQATVLEPIFFTDQSADAISWQWNFGDGIGTSSSQNPQHTYTNKGVYPITLIVSNALGCTDTLVYNYKIDALLGPVVPLAFTPNADGNNDILFVRGGPFMQLQFRVYNQWGEMIFETNDQTTGWDGTKQGKEQPGGVYVYTVVATMLDGQQQTISGDVTLLR
jgi:gliding motility-associated-like protein